MILTTRFSLVKFDFDFAKEDMKKNIFIILLLIISSCAQRKKYKKLSSPKSKVIKIVVEGVECMQCAAGVNEKLKKIETLQEIEYKTENNFEDGYFIAYCSVHDAELEKKIHQAVATEGFTVNKILPVAANEIVK